MTLFYTFSISRQAADNNDQDNLNFKLMIPLSNVLVVEDSASIQLVLAESIQSTSGIEVSKASTLAEANVALQENKFLCAVLDLNLPDAPNGEIVELVQGKRIPIIVLTGSIESAVKNTLDSDLVIDYITKRDISEIERATTTVRNIYNNQTMKVLVVDDSISARNYMTDLLQDLRYPVVTAEDGVQALERLEENEDVCLVISDYNMPRMNGIELIQEIRSSHCREDIAILGLSAQDDNDLISRFLKSGADDYMRKPFITDEFYCRVFHCTNAIAYMRTIREAATCDFLTRVSNRRNLFDIGERIYARARKGQATIATIMIDADHFKQVNDTYGHDTGDRVLVAIAHTLKTTLRPTDVVARFGGEEFVCIASLNEIQDVAVVCERIRMAIETMQIDLGSDDLSITVSVGATCELTSSFSDMIKLADEGLYQAKDNGRNRCVVV